MNINPRIENVGAGAGQVYKQIDSSETNQLRTIVAGAGISVTNNTSDVTIAATGGTPVNIFEQLLAYYWYMSYAAYNISNPAADLQGKNMVTGGQPSDLVRLHSNYAGGTIKMEIAGYFFSPSNTNNNTINVKCRWQSIGDDLDVAFGGAGVNLTITKPNTGGYRVFHTGLVSLSPEGSWTSAKSLFVRYKRTDADTDNTPIITQVRINYPVA